MRRPTRFAAACKEAAAKATSEKVAGDAIEAYLRNACSGADEHAQERASIAFRMKNGMSAQGRRDDADMTVDDYVATPVDNYKFMAQHERAAKPRRRRPPRTPAPTRAPASATAKALGSLGGDLAEDVIEHQPAVGGQRDARAVARQVAGARPAGRPAPSRRSPAARSARRWRRRRSLRASRKPMTSASSAASIGESGASSAMPWPLRAQRRQEILGLACGAPCACPSRRPCAPGPIAGIIAVAPVGEVVAALLAAAARGC